MKKGKKMWLVILLILGLVGSGAIYLAFNANMVDVVVATKTVDGNHKISSDMITTKRVDKSALPDNYLSAKYFNEVKGRYTNIGFTSGSVLTTGNVATKDSKKSAVIPEGKTLLSITVQNLPQGVQPNDRVNLIVGMSMQNAGKGVFTYQNVLVTNTYTDADGSITGLEIQVTPEQAQKIQYAQINGTLNASVLPLGNEAETDLGVVNESSMTDYKASESNSSSSDDSSDNGSYDGADEAYDDED